MKVKFGVLLLLAFAIGSVAPMAADSFGPVMLGITNNPCQGGTCVPKDADIATVSAIQLDPTQVQFTVQALSGYSIQIQSNDFFNFNTDIVPLSALSLDHGVVTVFGNGGNTTVNTKVNTDVTGQAGTGQFDLGLNDTSNPPKINGSTVTGAHEIQFVIDLGTGANVSTLLASNFYPQPNKDGWNFELHFCDGNGPSCTAPTGFVVDTGTPTVTPEPASMTLFFTGLAGAGPWLLRRRKIFRP